MEILDYEYSCFHKQPFYFIEHVICDSYVIITLLQLEILKVKVRSIQDPLFF